MKYSTLISLFSLALISLSPAQAAATPGPETRQVMLQGSSAPELRALVEHNGGSITHDLHIINAVGAMLTQEQLDQVLKSKLITRHIDDLSISEEPEDKPEDTKKSCEVAGHLELDFNTSGFSWKLYNKHPEPASLEKLELDWPKSLGTVQQISLGKTTIDPALYNSSQPGSLKLQFNKSEAPTLAEIADLQVKFKSPAQSLPQGPLWQRDFTIEASFFGDCSTKLIPGYDDNHENFYYTTLAGAGALHLQGITGKGVTIAVLDSGLWEHDALTKNTLGEQRITARYDATTGTKVKEVFDASGHGTHMTSVIAHSGPVTMAGKSTGIFQGIAPDANLISVKALDEKGRGDLLDIVRGVQWVVDHQQYYNIQVLNLSFAARPRWHYWEDPINQSLMKAWAKGIAVVAAAGNEGPDPMTIGSPGNLPYIITVGAMTDSWTPNTRDDDYIPDFSSRGPTPSGHIKPDIVAPGGHITGLTRPHSNLSLKHPEYMLSTGELVMTGSSQASAVVSGIAALLLQLEPNLRPDDIKCKLITSAEPAINRDGLLSYSPFEQGHGQVSAVRAVTLGQTGCNDPNMDISLEIQSIEHFQGPAMIEDNGNFTLPGLSKLVSAEPSKRGFSQTRKWGVKAHIEREGQNIPTPNPNLPPAVDWYQIYLLEKAVIEGLAKPTPE